MSDLYDELFGKDNTEESLDGVDVEIGYAEYKRMTEQRVNPTQAPIRRNGRMVGEWDPEYM